VLKLLLVKERIVATALVVTLTFAVARLLGLTAQAQEATL
jgi:citrate synthase